MTEEIPIAQIEAVYRFPVKSMAGEELNTAVVQKTGLEGDRRYAFIRRLLAATSDFPWFTGRQFPSLLLYLPQFLDPSNIKRSLVLVNSPSGHRFPIDSPNLARELSETSGHKLSLVKRGAGIPDSMAISLLGLATVKEIGDRIRLNLDPLRFRPNILLRMTNDREGTEDNLVGQLIRIGDRDNSPILAVVERDSRCIMVNTDPRTAEVESRVLVEINHSRKGQMGVYASVVRPGTIYAKDPVYAIPY